MTLLTATHWFMILSTLVTGLSLLMLMWRKAQAQKTRGLVPLPILTRRK